MKDYLKIAVIAILFLFTGCQKQEFPVQDAIRQITLEGYSRFELDFELQEWQKSKYPDKIRAHRESYRKEIGVNSEAYEVILLEYNDIDDYGYTLTYFVNFGNTDCSAGSYVYKLLKDSPNEFIVLTDFDWTKNWTSGMKPFRDERLYEKITLSDAMWLYRLGKRTYRTYKLTLEFGKSPVLEHIDYYKDK